MQQLPEPDQEAAGRSMKLMALIKAECAEAQAGIPFSRFMQLALYAPELGYYTGGSQKFGRAGDYITAPEVSPLFSQCVARQAAQITGKMEHADILEFGAGSGLMAADMLLELERLGALPHTYFIIELSAELRDRQRQTLKQKASHLLPIVQWLDTLPERRIQGVVVANEVLDAMPVECFRINHGDVEQLRVSLQEDKLQAAYRHADAALVEQVRAIERLRGGVFGHGYRSELNPAISAWLDSIHDFLSMGLVLLIDYGYPVGEYYLEERNGGTLICHYRHRAHADPLWYPGLQDITAFVDFSAVAQAAVDAGFDVSGYTSQAMFLMGCGLAELHQSVVSDDPRQQLFLAQQIKTLTLPSEMGERFKAMALTKGMDLPLIGFALQDFTNRL